MEILLFTAFAATGIYCVVALALAIARQQSERVRARTAKWAARELRVTTWWLALPGLVAAMIGLMVLIGAIPLALGILTLVAAHTVTAGRSSAIGWLPIVFCIAVDGLFVWAVVSAALGARDYPSAGLNPLEALAYAGVALYLTICTWNAVRIGSLSRTNARRSSAGEDPPSHVLVRLLRDQDAETEDAQVDAGTAQGSQEAS